MRFLIIIFLFVNFSFSCALCALMTPTAHIFMEFYAQNSSLKNIKISWYFSQNFKNAILQSYDINANAKLDNTEINEINFAMNDYLKSRNYLMSFEYYDENSDKIQMIEGNFTTGKFAVENNELIFKFDYNVDLSVVEGRILKIIAKDDEGYFNFKILNEGFALIGDLKLNFNSNLNSTFAKFSTFAIGQKMQNKPKISNLNENKSDFITTQSLKYLENLKSAFNEKNSIFMIIILSFLYGFFHAAGPGHAKILTTSYFIANGGNLLKSFLFSLKIGYFHILGAFLIVVFSMFLTNLAGYYTKNSVVALTTKISAIMIIFIAIFIIFSKVKSFLTKPKISWNNAKIGKSKIFQTQTHACSCLTCNPKKPKNINEWLIALSVAIIPCPGTILVFLLAFGVGSYFLSAVSAFFMGFGMSLVIFLSAIFGSSINKFAKLSKFRIFAEFFGVFIMFVLGIFMFLISNEMQNLELKF